MSYDLGLFARYILGFFFPFFFARCFSFLAAALAAFRSREDVNFAESFDPFFSVDGDGAFSPV